MSAARPLGLHLRTIWPNLQRNLGGRWLMTGFRAGDVLLFSMCLVHGAIDNHSPKNAAG